MDIINMLCEEARGEARASAWYRASDIPRAHNWMELYSYLIARTIIWFGAVARVIIPVAHNNWLIGVLFLIVRTIGR